MKKISFIKINLIVACITVFSSIHSQNVGIGTNSPGYQFSVRRDDTLAIATIEVRNSTTRLSTDSRPNAQILFGGYRDVTLSSHPLGAIRSFAVSSDNALVRSGEIGFFTNQGQMGVGYDQLFERMRISRFGNVGIGTTTPSKKLTVVGGSIQPAVGNNSDAGISFPSDPGAGNGDSAYIRYFVESGENTKLLIGNTNDADDDISFYQSGGERLTIANGNIGIGTTSPLEVLDVRGNINVGNSDTSNYIAFRGLSGDGNGSYLQSFIGNRLYAGPDRSELLIFQGSESQLALNNTGDRIRLASPEIRFQTSLLNSPSNFEGVARKTVYLDRMIINEKGSVGIGTTNPSSSAILDLSSTSMGLAIPAMSSAQRKAISLPTLGLQVYDTDLKGIYIFDGTWDCLNVPAGTVQYAARNTPPRGYLEANGQVVNRTTYAELFAAIGTTYGAGDGTTTFNLPDLRGEFVRGWSNGRSGADFGRPFGSSQSSDNLSHNHGINDPGHFHTFSTINDDFNNSGGNPPGFSADSAGSRSWDTNNKTTGITIQNSGGSESRPRNIALLPIIKF